MVHHVKPGSLPAFGGVWKVIVEVLVLDTHSQLEPGPATTTVGAVELGWGLRWNKYLNKVKQGGIPRKASQK